VKVCGGSASDAGPCNDEAIEVYERFRGTVAALRGMKVSFETQLVAERLGAASGIGK
jgi:hypothetical protein